MSRKPKRKNADPVAVRSLAANRDGSAEDRAAANVGAHPVRRVVEFPKLRAADDVVSDRIIFEVGGDRFAIEWTAEIQRLPPAGPVALNRRQRGKTDGSP
jgi:hypothetical protein